MELNLREFYVKCEFIIIETKLPPFCVRPRPGGKIPPTLRNLGREKDINNNIMRGESFSRVEKFL